MLARASFSWCVREYLGVLRGSRGVMTGGGGAGGSETTPIRKPNTPIGKLDESGEVEETRHPYQEKEPLEAFPDNVNPTTGEVGGPGDLNHKIWRLGAQGQSLGFLNISNLMV